MIPRSLLGSIRDLYGLLCPGIGWRGFDLWILFVAIFKKGVIA
ncbi:MAG: hypothetical protein BWY45_03477 [Euryarchaeota archaeon ADurb.Bin294]|nr:MAG: hypothetical protein BWY45_03477 [Euryarchaeota archaeon ADurb.Bin294]